MNMNEFTKSVTIATLVGVFSLPAHGFSDSGAKPAIQTPQALTATSHSKTNPALNDDFAGLTFTAEQKSQISAIHEDTVSKVAIVKADTKLDQDQKGAMISGYARMENGRIFAVLTPIQQKQVRAKIQARRATEQAAHKKQSQPPQK